MFGPDQGRVVSRQLVVWKNGDLDWTLQSDRAMDALRLAAQLGGLFVEDNHEKPLFTPPGSTTCGGGLVARQAKSPRPASQPDDKLQIAMSTWVLKWNTTALCPRLAPLPAEALLEASESRVLCANIYLWIHDTTDYRAMNQKLTVTGCDRQSRCPEWHLLMKSEKKGSGQRSYQ